MGLGGVAIAALPSVVRLQLVFSDRLWGGRFTHSCAASQLAVGFHYIGPAPRNPQLKLNLLVVRGCVAMASRRSHAPINLRLIL